MISEPFPHRRRCLFGMGASAHRLHPHVEYPTVADAVIETLLMTKKVTDSSDT